MNTLLTVSECCALLRMGRTNFYKILASGQLQAVKMGKKTLVSKESVQDFISSLQPYSTEKLGA